ncbi:hypothetical protein [Niveibacterium sp. SC-1]|uniref:hypothetical protein n=1 Tax=Niveibacterium sp. SC-1 TaxID=3135646 RepID=UPI00311D9478
MSLFSAVADFLKPSPPPDPAVREALERAAELIDPMLRAAVADFDDALSAPITHALNYCDGLVAALPGPLDVNRQAFATDPLVHALFATADDIRQMLGRSEAVRDFLAGPDARENEQFFVMLAARRMQRQQLALAEQGGIIRSEVPQTVVYFSGQTLIEPSCQLDEMRQRLRRKALESLLLSFQSHVQALREEREGLRAELSAGRAQQKALQGNAECGVRTRHLVELDRTLRDKAESLMPEQLVAALADHLRAPESALFLTPASVTVDRMGVVQAQANDDDVFTLDFPELTARDRRQYLTTLARISREEALEAVAMVRDEQRRFMII